MRRIDEQYLKMPWYGSRQMKRQLVRQGFSVGGKRVRRLRRLMGLRSVAPGPNTSRKHPAYPYLLRDRVIDALNQAWCADVTYIPLAHGFVYLVAIMDWHARHVLSWRLSTTQGTSFCLEALEEALERYGAPAIAARVSQPRELPPRLLSEPGVNLSAHRAPVAPTENPPRPFQ